MEYLTNLALLDESGSPLGPHIQRVLRDLVPRLQRQFPSLKDEVVLAEILEEAGRKIADHEQRSGPIEKLHAYAWVSVRSVATSRMRRGSMRIARATVDSEEGESVLAALRSSSGTAEQIEADILIEQLLAHLTPEERLICIWKRFGFSSREIAREQGTSVSRVNTFFHRVKRKIRNALRGTSADVASSRTPRRTKRDCLATQAMQ